MMSRLPIGAIGQENIQMTVASILMVLQLTLKEVAVMIINTVRKVLVWLLMWTMNSLYGVKVIQVVVSS